MLNRQPVARAASQIRASQVVQQLVNQPAQRVVVSAPQVANPVITPAIAEARRMRIHDGDKRNNGRPGGQVLQSAPAARIVVPPSPSRINNPAARARVDGENRAGRPGNSPRLRDTPEAEPSIQPPVPGSNRALAQPPARVVPPPAVAPQARQPQPTVRQVAPQPPEERRMRAHPAQGRGPQWDQRSVQQAPPPVQQVRPVQQTQPQPQVQQRGQPSMPPQPPQAQVQQQPAQPAPPGAGRRQDGEDPQERGRGAGGQRPGRTEMR